MHNNYLLGSLPMMPFEVYLAVLLGLFGGLKSWWSP